MGCGEIPRLPQLNRILSRLPQLNRILSLNSVIELSLYIHLWTGKRISVLGSGSNACIHCSRVWLRLLFKGVLGGKPVACLVYCSCISSSISLCIHSRSLGFIVAILYYKHLNHRLIKLTDCVCCVVIVKSSLVIQKVLTFVDSKP